MSSAWLLDILKKVQKITPAKTSTKSIKPMTGKISMPGMDCKMSLIIVILSVIASAGRRVAIC